MQWVGWIYRINNRSRKWTLRLIFHDIDLATVCACNECQKYAAEVSVPPKDQLDLLAFRLICQLKTTLSKIKLDQ